METQLMIKLRNDKTATKIIFASDTHRIKKSKVDFENHISSFPFNKV